MNPSAFATTHAAAFPERRAWSRTDFEKAFANDRTIVGGDAQSYVIGSIVLDEVEILTVATDPAYRRKGLAGKALEDFRQQAQAKGALRVFLEVAADNHAAKALYQSAGFAQIAVRKAYYRREGQPSCDAIIMQLHLS